MSNIIRRLRAAYQVPELPIEGSLLLEAIREIERLRTALMEIAEDRPRSHPIDIARRALESSP